MIFKEEAIPEENKDTIYQAALKVCLLLHQEYETKKQEIKVMNTVSKIAEVRESLISQASP